MSVITSPDLVALIVEALYPISANSLPAVCQQLGLSPGDRDEAMNSKRGYVRRRIATLDFDELRGISEKTVKIRPTIELLETLAKLDEAGDPELGEIARRRIIKLFDDDYSLSGDLTMVEFIEPLWPISTLMTPSIMGSGEITLKDQIERHADLNGDWSGADVLTKIGALTWSRNRFCRLLEAAVHPRALDDDDVRAALVEAINQHLRPGGWSLQGTGRTSGLILYTVERISQEGQHEADTTISQDLSAFDEENVHAVWQKALNRRTLDPQGAITAARTLLETVCKYVLDDAGVPYNEKDDLPKLYRATAQALRLAPSQHTEEVFKQILGGCSAVVEGLGSLRNRLGDAHGQGRKPARPAIRHAQLVVNLAGAMAVFLVSTWTEKVKGVP